MDKECCVCQNFTAYFTKAYCCFLRTDCGHCRITDTTVKKHFTCEKFKHKYVNRGDKRNAVIEGLEKAVRDIAVIKFILEENEQDPTP